MSINLGTTEVELGLYSKALQLATFTVEVPGGRTGTGQRAYRRRHATTSARDRDSAAQRFRRKSR